MSWYGLQRRSTSAPKELRVESLASAVDSTVYIALLPDSFHKLLVLQSDPDYDQEKQNDDRQFPPVHKGNVGQKKTGPRRKDDAHVIRRVLGSGDGFPERLDPFRFGRREAVARPCMREAAVFGFRFWNKGKVGIPVLNADQGAKSVLCCEQT